MNSLTLEPLSSQEINISEAIAEIVGEITKFSDSFSHIDTNRIHICMSSNRRNGRGAIFGKLVPLKFKDGDELLNYRGNCYAMPRVVRDGHDILYLIYFYSPRFVDLPPIEKLRVIFHELYHISPDFNGDLRRFGKRKILHGHSKEKYDSYFEKELWEFHDYIKNSELFGFLKMDSKTLFKRYKRVYSNRMKVPKPVIISAAKRNKGY